MPFVQRLPDKEDELNKSRKKCFTIKDLERYSGIKAHTLRTWERRYCVLKPERTPTNIRHYTLQEVRVVLNMALLNKSGYKISHLVALSPFELEDKVHQLTGASEKQEAILIELLVHMYSMHIDRFEAVLDRCFAMWDHDTVLNAIIYPFLNNTGILWRGHRLDEEHFVVTAIRKKLILAIESIRKPENSQRTVLLFLYGQSQLDLALLFTNYLLKRSGVKVLYMGNDISLSNLKAYLQTSFPQFLYTYLPQKNNFPFSDVSLLLKNHVPGSRLIVSTYPECPHREAAYNNVVSLCYVEAIQTLLG